MDQAPSILLKNVHIFDGVKPRLSSEKDVRVEAGMIASITSPPRQWRTQKDDGFPRADVVIDGAGRTLMPGLIDMHTHLSFAGVSQVAALTGDVYLLGIAAAVGAEQTLLRGFTSCVISAGRCSGSSRRLTRAWCRGHESILQERSSLRPGGTGTSVCPSRSHVARTAN